MEMVSIFHGSIHLADGRISIYLLLLWNTLQISMQMWPESENMHEITFLLFIFCFIFVKCGKIFN